MSRRRFSAKKVCAVEADSPQIYLRGGAMGSEAIPAANVVFHLTGFKKFHGVPENPTEVLVSNIEEYMSTYGMPLGATLGSCTILETAGLGALGTLQKLLDSALPIPSSQRSLDQGEKPESIIWVRLLQRQW